MKGYISGWCDGKAGGKWVDIGDLVEKLEEIAGATMNNVYIVATVDIITLFGVIVPRQERLAVIGSPTIWVVESSARHSYHILVIFLTIKRVEE